MDSMLSIPGNLPNSRVLLTYFLIFAASSPATIPACLKRPSAWGKLSLVTIASVAGIMIIS